MLCENHARFFETPRKEGVRYTRISMPCFEHDSWKRFLRLRFHLKIKMVQHFTYSCESLEGERCECSYRGLCVNKKLLKDISSVRFIPLYDWRKTDNNTCELCDFSYCIYRSLKDIYYCKFNRWQEHIMQLYTSSLALNCWLIKLLMILCTYFWNIRQSPHYESIFFILKICSLVSNFKINQIVPKFILWKFYENM